MSDSADQMEERWDEMINGKIVAMSPRPTVNHNHIAGNIHTIFNVYLKGKKCMPFGDGTDLYLSPTDRFVPDGMVVCNRDIIKTDGVHGAPDLVIEVLSPTTAKNDRGYKKDAYAKAGVKEYWIVDTHYKAVEVYLLADGAFVLDNIYAIFPDYVMEKMNEEEKASIVTEFKCSMFSDLTISLNDIFAGML